ncbi:MAG: hypothetical protein ACI9MC_002931 [Kiritimatiellia bacterium]|jgi:hypothetical protein
MNRSLHNSLLFSLTLLLVACNSGSDEPTDEACLLSEVTVTPIVLDFGDVAIGHPSTLEVEVINSGCFELELVSLDMQQGSSPAFSVASEFEAQPIRVSQRVLVQMQFYAATKGEAAGKIDIVTDLRYDGVKTVDLSGTGI